MPKKFALLGPYGYGSLGDAALLEAMLQNIRKQYPDAQITGIALNPQDTERWHKIPAYPMTECQIATGGVPIKWCCRAIQCADSPIGCAITPTAVAQVGTCTLPFAA